MNNKQSSLEPISAENLDNFYGCSGNGQNCREIEKKSTYNPNCCWHDCKKIGSAMATKFWTARS